MIESVCQQFKSISFSDPVGGRKLAEELDAKDSLSHFRSKFLFPQINGKDSIYLCGNSLGLQPKSVRSLLDEELQVWSESAVEGHFDHAFGRPWVTVDEECCRLLKPLIGAASESEVAAMGCLSTNLHLLLHAFYQPTKDRYKILIEDKAFPSDYYIVESQIVTKGFKVEDALLIVKPREGEDSIRNEDVLDIIEKEGDSIAVIMFSGMQFLSGQLFPMADITKAAQAKGCYVGFDLAHAIGNVPMKLHDWNVDFAAWCTYKYLNAGPGGMAGIFVHSKHDNNTGLKILRGWWGARKETRFEMNHAFEGLSGAKGFQHSNPSVVAMTCLLASLRIFAQTDIGAIRAKSAQLVAFFRALVSDVPKDQLDIITPADEDASGAQLSIRIPQVPLSEFMPRIKSAGIICDARKNQVIRIAFTGLYNSFCDVFDAAQILCAQSHA